EAVAQIRSIVHALHRDALPSRPLERLDRETALARSGLGFLPTLALQPSAERIETVLDSADADLVDDLVAVVREGLSNAARHAQAGAVAVVICAEQEARTPPGEQLTVTVTDDGVGVPVERDRSSGLANLARRAERW